MTTTQSRIHGRPCIDHTARRSVRLDWRSESNRGWSEDGREVLVTHEFVTATLMSGRRDEFVFTLPLKNGEAWVDEQALRITAGWSRNGMSPREILETLNDEDRQ